jgi:hypothetical protein
VVDVNDPDAYQQGEEQTLSGVLAKLAAEGYTSNFGVTGDGAVVTCYACRREQAAAKLDIQRVQRLEGASDPDDMLIVLGAACSECHERGALVLNFGPEATLADAEVLGAITLPEERGRA